MFCVYVGCLMIVRLNKYAVTLFLISDWQLALRRAYKSITIGFKIPTENFPACYHPSEYDHKSVMAKNHNHIIVGHGQYTYWFDDGEKVARWTSWTVTDIDKFILKYYHRKIHGQFAAYPLVFTQLLYGSQFAHMQKGKLIEYESKLEKVRNLVIYRLDNIGIRDLKSFSHRINVFLLTLVR